MPPARQGKYWNFFSFATRHSAATARFIFLRAMYPAFQQLPWLPITAIDKAESTHPAHGSSVDDPAVDAVPALRATLEFRRRVFFLTARALHSPRPPWRRK